MLIAISTFTATQSTEVTFSGIPAMRQWPSVQGEGQTNKCWLWRYCALGKLNAHTKFASTRTSSPSTRIWLYIHVCIKGKYHIHAHVHIRTCTHTNLILIPLWCYHLWGKTHTVRKWCTNVRVGEIVEALTVVCIRLETVGEGGVGGQHSLNGTANHKLHNSKGAWEEEAGSGEGTGSSDFVKPMQYLHVASGQTFHYSITSEKYFITYQLIHVWRSPKMSRQ